MADHARDSQAAAFRDVTESDLVTDEQLLAMLRTGELSDTTDLASVSVDDHEAAGWDAGRVGPKSVDEARAALLGRVDEPSAPDNDPHAYDEV